MPEFRIAEDVRMAVDSLVEFAASMFNASISAAAFIVVLWSVGGSIRIPVGGGVEVPGYMVWLAVVYAILLSGGISLLGRPLVRASERKNAAEASLRADMMELGQIPVGVSLRHGDELQRRHVVRDIELLFGRWRKIVLYQSEIAIIVNANYTFMPIVPLLAAVPKYFSGDITLGAVMQLSAAFVQAQMAFNWYFDNYVRIAEWLANLTRVVKLLDALDSADSKGQVRQQIAPADAQAREPNQAK